MTLPVLALAWLLGIAAVALWGVEPWLPAAWVAALVPAAGAWWGRRNALLVAVAAAFALVAAGRFEAWQERPAPDLARYVGAEATIEGVVASEPDPGLTTRTYRVDARRILADERWRETNGAVLIRLSQFAGLDRGARVLVTGTLDQPPAFERFDYRGYLARQGIVATALFPEVEVLAGPSRWNATSRLAELRLDLDRSLARALPEPEASLAAGIAFGRDANLPRDLYDDARETNLAHLVAVSGANVAVVAALAFFALVPLAGRRTAIWPAGLLVFAYVVVAGASWSVVRAGIMAGLYLMGAYLGRPRSSLAALAAAVIIMTAIDRDAPADLGFQLSVAATAGLIAFVPWLRWAFERGLAALRLDGLVPNIGLTALALTLAASLGTLPLVWANFGAVSLAGPLANVLVEPLFVLAFGLSLLTAFAGIAWEPAGWVAGLAAYYPLTLIRRVAETGADFRYAAVSVPAGSGNRAFAGYAVLAAGGWLAYRRYPPEIPPRLPRPAVQIARRVIVAAAIGGFAAFVATTSLLPLRTSDELTVAVLDVGQGDAILVTFPGGERLLVDGGPSGIALARELGGILPHWERRIERVVLTHPQEDHVAGLPGLFDRFDAGTVSDAGLTNETAAVSAYRRGAGTIERLQQGTTWRHHGVEVDVLWPPPAVDPRNLNNGSVVLRLRYGQTSFLLTGDIEAAGQAALLREGGVAATVLKVPHHGAATNDQDFIAAVRPQVAVISAGADNRFGHPRQETLDALAGSTLLRTDLHGRVTIRSNGSRVRVSMER